MILLETSKQLVDVVVHGHVLRLQCKKLRFGIRLLTMLARSRFSNSVQCIHDTLVDQIGRHLRNGGPRKLSADIESRR